MKPGGERSNASSKTTTSTMVPLSKTQLLLLPDAAPAAKLNLADGADGAVVKLPCAAQAAAWDEDSGRLLTAGADKCLRLWHAAQLTAPVASWVHAKKIVAVAFAPAEPNVGVFADKFGDIFSVRLDDASISPTIRCGHFSPVSHMLFAPHCAQLLSADREGHVRAACWPHTDVIEQFYLTHTTNVQIVLPIAPTTHVPALLVSANADGSQVCVFSYDGGLLLYCTSCAELRLQWSQGSGENCAALECAASCGASCDERASLVALGFRGESALFFAHVADAADAIAVVRNRTARFALDASPLALSCVGTALHVLTSASVVMLDVGGAGGVVQTIASVDISALLQSAAPACVDSADDDADDDQDNEAA